MLAPFWYSNLSNLSSRTPPISSLVFLSLNLSSHYQSVLLPHYEPMTISNNIAQASPRLVPPLISHVYHQFGHDLFLCDDKCIVAYASQLRLVIGYVAF
jgi:hypothetical protein